MRLSAHAYNETSICEPTLILPSQWWERNRAAASPELRLVAAVLENAIESIIKNTAARRGPRFKDFTDACNWVLEERPDWPFAFANVCEVLGLDPTAVRERVRAILDARLAADATSPDPLASIRSLRFRSDRLGQHWREQKAG